MRTVLGWLTTAVVLLPSVAGAQAPPDWALAMRTGEPILITLKNGERVHGTVAVAARDGISVETPEGLKTADYPDIQKAQRRDSVRNGVLLGAGVGVVIASLPLVIGNECRYETCGSQLGFPLAGATIGGLIGWGLDSALKGWTSVFDAGASARLSVDSRRRGFSLQAVFTW